MFTRFDEEMMRAALSEAAAALRAGEIAVGCVIARGGEIIACAHNDRGSDPTGHAEILAIRQAARALGDWRLADCTLYVTLEPCPMCAGAIVMARVGRLVFGAHDPQYGCAGSVYRIPEDPAFPHFCRSDGGLLHEECAALLRKSFELTRALTPRG